MTREKEKYCGVGRSEQTVWGHGRLHNLCDVLSSFLWSKTMPTAIKQRPLVMSLQAYASESGFKFPCSYLSLSPQFRGPSPFSVRRQDFLPRTFDFDQHFFLFCVCVCFLSVHLFFYVSFSLQRNPTAVSLSTWGTWSPNHFYLSPSKM